MNRVFLDAAPIQIGANVLIGPAVQLLTVSHPLAAAERLVDAAARRAGAAPYRTFARPITIGDGAWIGAGTLVLPGVTIGAGAVVGAGSVVTADIPPHCVAFGNPCRVQRSIEVTEPPMSRWLCSSGRGEHLLRHAIANEAHSPHALTRVGCGQPPFSCHLCLEIQ